MNSVSKYNNVKDKSLNQNMNVPIAFNNNDTTRFTKDDVNVSQTPKSMVCTKIINTPGVPEVLIRQNAIATEVTTSTMDETANNNNEKEQQKDNNVNYYAAMRETVICRPIEPTTLKDFNQVGMIYTKQQQQQQQQQLQTLNQNYKKQQLNATSIKMLSTAPTTASTTTTAIISSMVTPADTAQKPQKKIIIPALNIQKQISVPKITITSPPCDKTNCIGFSSGQQLEDVKRRLNRQILSRRLDIKTTLLLPAPQKISRTAINSNISSSSSITNSNSPIKIISGNSTFAATSTAVASVNSCVPISSKISVQKIQRIDNGQQQQQQQLQQPLQHKILLTTNSQPFLLANSIDKTTTIKQNTVQNIKTNAGTTILGTINPQQFAVTLGTLKNYGVATKPIENVNSWIVTPPKMATTTTTQPIQINTSDTGTEILPKLTVRIVKAPSNENKTLTESGNISTKLKLYNEELKKSPPTTTTITTLPTPPTTIENKTLTENDSKSKVTNIPIVLENKLLNADEKIDLKDLRLPARSNETSQTTSTTSTKNKVENMPTQRRKKMHLIVSADKLKSSTPADMAVLAKAIMQRVGKPTTSPKPITTTKPKVVISSSTTITTTSKPTTKLLTEEKTVTDLKHTEKQSNEIEIETEKEKEIENENEIIKPHKVRPTIPKASISPKKTNIDPPKLALRKKVLAFCGIKDEEIVTPVKEYPDTVEIVDENSVDIVEDSAVDFIASLGVKTTTTTPMETTVELKKEKIKIASKKISKEVLKTVMENVESSTSLVVEEGEKQTTSVEEQNTIESNVNECPTNTQSLEMVKTNSKEMESNADETIGVKIDNLPINVMDDMNSITLQADQIELVKEDVTLEMSNAVEILETVEAVETIETTETIAPKAQVETVKVVELESCEAVDVVLPKPVEIIKSTAAETSIEMPKPVEEVKICESKVEIPKLVETIETVCAPKVVRTRIGRRNATINLVTRKKPSINQSKLKPTTLKEVGKKINEENQTDSILEPITLSEVDKKSNEEKQKDSILEPITLTEVDKKSNEDQTDSKLSTKLDEETVKEKICEGPEKVLNMETIATCDSNSQNDINSTNNQLIEPTVGKLEEKVVECKEHEMEIERNESLLESKSVESVMVEVENVEIQKENVAETETETETEPKKVDIKILASVNINESQIFFEDIISRESTESVGVGVNVDSVLKSKTVSETSSVVVVEKTCENSPIIPEVGTIIDMEAYGLENSDAQIIVEDVELKNFNEELSKEEVNSEKEANILHEDQSEIFSSQKSNDDEPEQMSDADNMNDNSNASVSVNSLVGRKRLRRKKRRHCSISTSESDHETKADFALKSCRPLNILYDTQLSSGSNSSELFGFSVPNNETNNLLNNDDETKKIPGNLNDWVNNPLVGTNDEFMFSIPAAATTTTTTVVDSRRHVPLKKRWELSQQHQQQQQEQYQDETDITDDTSPAADDDTMDEEDITPKYSKLMSSKEETSILNDENDKLIKPKSSPSVENHLNELDKLITPASSPLQNPINEVDTLLKPTSSSLLQNPKENSITAQFDEGKAFDATQEIVENYLMNANKLQSILPTVVSIEEFDAKIPMEKATKNDKTTMEMETENVKEKSEVSTETTERTEETEGVEETQKNTPQNLESNPKEPLIESSNIDEQIQLVTSTPQPKRRGRPAKRISNIDPVEDSYENTSKIRILETTAEQNKSEMESIDVSTISTSIVASNEIEIATPDVSMKKKRGRPRIHQITKVETSNVEAITPQIYTGKKRGRKPRVNVSDLDVTKQTECNEESNNSLTFNLNTTIEDFTAESLTLDQTVEIKPQPSEKRKRGRKPKVVTERNDETLNSFTAHCSLLVDNTTPKVPIKDSVDREIFLSPVRKRRCRVVGDFNARLLLIRNREQLESDEVLTEPVAEDDAAEANLLQCGLCLARTERTNWVKHISEHYGVGWVVGKEPEVDVSTRSVVLSRMLAHFKRSGVTNLSCRLCARSYRSPLGMLLHLELCGDADSRVNCPSCNNEYSKLSMLQHQRVCSQNKTNESTTIDESTDTSMSAEVFNGRNKRASLLKAKSKLKKLSKELDDTESNFEPKNLINYQTVGSEAEVGYYCLACTAEKIRFETEDAALQHIEAQHKPQQKSKKGSKSAGSDFDEGSGQESADSSDSGDTEHSTNDGETEEETTTNRKKSNSGEKKRRVLNSSRPINKLESVYPNRSGDFAKILQKRLKQFLSTNYTDESLFSYALPTYESSDFKVKPSKLLPTAIESMKFVNTTKQKLSKKLGISKPQEDWQSLKRFEALNQTANEKLIFIGGPIKSLAWAPLPSTVKEQYLLIAYRRELSTFTRFHKPKVEDTLLLLYKVTREKQQSDEVKTKILKAEIHYTLLIPKGPVHTFTFLPSGGYDASKNRLGLLAVGTACSDIKIYALPIDPEESNSQIIEVENSVEPTLRVIQLQAALELSVDGNSDECDNSKHTLVATHCLQITWSEFAGHQHIFASFSNGYIGIWNIKEENASDLNLNCLIRNGRPCFLPINYFYLAEKSVNGLGVHYDSSGPRWLAAHGCARKLIVYDIRNLTQPIPLKEELCKNVPRGIDWSPLWEPLAVGLCDSIPHHGRSVITINPVGVNYASSRMHFTLAGVSTLHYNPWLNIYGCGTDNGDIVYMNNRELNHELKGRKRNFYVFSAMDICRLDGESLLYPKSERMPDNWQVFDKEYKSKYGLVYGPIVKLPAEKRSTFYEESRIPPRNVERLMRINAMRWNLNENGKSLAAIGYENGFLRLTNFDYGNFYK